MKENLIENKSFEFAVRIVNLYKYLRFEKQEFVMSKQLLKCGTSIGANISEAERGQTTPDFLSKMNIALKESNETHFWLKLLHRTDYIDRKMFESMENDIIEIIRILMAICKTTNESINYN
ncbi:MAG: four helix bundle protein [Ruminococcaceae bacterium]|nr:four helix bundle protein [Oscillospiraceae bacterium]